MLLSVPEAMEDLISMKRLWVHEVLRVYYDRLVDDSDRSWLFDQLHMVIKERLEEDMDEMFLHLRTDDKKVILIHGTDSMHEIFLFFLNFILLLLLFFLFLIFILLFVNFFLLFSSSCFYLIFNFCKQSRHTFWPPHIMIYPCQY